MKPSEWLIVAAMLAVQFTSAASHRGTGRPQTSVYEASGGHSSAMQGTVDLRGE